LLDILRTFRLKSLSLRETKFPAPNYRQFGSILFALKSHMVTFDLLKIVVVPCDCIIHKQAKCNCHLTISCFEWMAKRLYHGNKWYNYFFVVQNL